MSDNDAQTAKPAKRSYPHGNYPSYYGYRNNNDSRLEALAESLSNELNGLGKCLDIGCNSGHITYCFFKTFKPSQITGVDIDSYLISLAKRNYGYYFADSSSACGSDASSRPYLPRNHPVMFLCANILQFEFRTKYDLILALSVTKWIHLNNGDDGLKDFFKKCAELLNTGGYFILEPQNWGSYHRKRLLNGTIKENFSQISFKPDDFVAFINNTCHLNLVSTLTQSCKDGNEFMRRPLYVFQKPPSS